jgi:hypothetical protein
VKIVTGTTVASIDVVVLNDNITAVQNAFSGFLNGESTVLRVTGDPSAPTSCLVQRLINQVHLDIDIAKQQSADAQASSTSFDMQYVELGPTDAQNASMSIHYSLGTSVIYGNIPAIELVIKDQVRALKSVLD